MKKAPDPSKAQSGIKKPASRQERRFFWLGLLFVSPWLIGFLLFQLYPILSALYYSFTDFNIFQPPEFVGLKNYITLFNDKYFPVSISNTAVMSFIGMPIGLVVSLLLALLVLTWCGGFDIIYALQDADFDRAHGLHSIPARFGTRGALHISILLHACSAAALLLFARHCPQGPLLWTGVGVFLLLLALQHVLVTPTRQRRIAIAFGTLNGLASLALALFVIADLLLRA